MAVFRVEKNSGYTVMSNHHLRNRALSLKAKGLLSQMLSLPEDWDYTLQGLARINKSIRVAGDDYPAELVKAKFLKLGSHHIEFVMDCLRDNTTKVRNIKQYLRAMLFNAPSTINSYYASLVAHDMAQPDWGRPPNT